MELLLDLSQYTMCHSINGPRAGFFICFSISPQLSAAFKIGFKKEIHIVMCVEFCIDAKALSCVYLLLCSKSIMDKLTFWNGQTACIFPLQQLVKFTDSNILRTPCHSQLMWRTRCELSPAQWLDYRCTVPVCTTFPWIEGRVTLDTKQGIWERATKHPPTMKATELAKGCWLHYQWQLLPEAGATATLSTLLVVMQKGNVQIVQYQRILLNHLCKII